MNIVNKCHYCQNDKENTIVELGGDRNDNNLEVNLWCKSCNTAFTVRYDATAFYQTPAEVLTKKYPNFKKDLENNVNEQTSATMPKEQRDKIQAARKTQLADTETNKDDIDKTKTLEPETVAKTQENRGQKQPG